MIKLDKVMEPVRFHKEVTKPGIQYLLSHPEAKGKLLPNLWNKCRDEVYNKYHGICAYLSIYLVKASGYEVDHFRPKSKHPEEAYKWDNLRLSCRCMNQKKGVRSIVDPIELPVASLLINFLTGRVHLSPSLSINEREALAATIQTLDLNSLEARETRTDAYTQYKRNKLDIITLVKRYPFAAFEMMRQHLLRKEDEFGCVEALMSVGYKTCADWLRDRPIN